MKVFNIVILLVFLINNTIIFAEGQCQEGYVSRYNGPCVPDEQTRADISTSRQCRDSENPEQCLRDIAQSESNRTNDDKNRHSNDYDTSGLGRGGQAAVHVAVILAAGYSLNFWLQKKKGKIDCKAAPPSMYLISAGALTALGAEVLSYIKYSKKLSELKNDLSALQAPAEDDPDTSKDDYYNNLTERAFDGLIKKEEAYLAATKVRKTGYMVAAGMFSAGMISAGIEEWTQWLDKNNPGKYNCYSKGATGKDGKELFNPKTAAEQNNNNRSGGGGGSMGMLLGFLPMLMGLVTDAGTEMAIPANPFENLDQLQLPSESKRLLSSLNQTESLEELNMIMKESEMFKSGAISSPTIEEFQNLRTNTELSLAETTNWKDQKEIMMMGALLTSQYDELGFLFNSDQVAALK